MSNSKAPLMAMAALTACLGLMASACFPSGPDGSLGIHTRNASRDPLGYSVESAGTSGWGRIAEGVGCTAIGAPWSISVGPADEDGAVGQQVHLLSSADVDDPLNAEIWIDVAKDGRVTWGQGTPEWAIGPVPSCGP
jgi:hypothetical protein